MKSKITRTNGLKNEMNWKLTSEILNPVNHPAEQFPILRPKQLNDDSIDYYLQYQSKDIKNIMKQFDFRYTDLEDEELVTLIDMIIESRDVYSQHKNDIGQTRQKFNVTLKPNSVLRKQRSSMCPFILKTN